MLSGLKFEECPAEELTHVKDCVQRRYAGFKLDINNKTGQVSRIVGGVLSSRSTRMHDAGSIPARTHLWE